MENLGGQTVLYTTTPGGQALTVVLEGQRPAELGSTVTAYIDPAKAHLFDAEGMAIWGSAPFGGPDDIISSPHPSLSKGEGVTPGRQRARPRGSTGSP